MSPHAPNARGTARISRICENATCVCPLNAGLVLVTTTRLSVTF